ncbi:MAG: hypothetical protein ABI142_05120, partial [Bryocella sp.]
AAAPALPQLRYPCPVACPDEKASTSLSMPAARPVVADSPPHRGPGRAAGHPGPHSMYTLRKRTCQAQVTTAVHLSS